MASNNPNGTTNVPSSSLPAANPATSTITPGTMAKPTGLILDPIYSSSLSNAPPSSSSAETPSATPSSSPSPNPGSPSTGPASPSSPSPSPSPPPPTPSSQAPASSPVQTPGLSSSTLLSSQPPAPGSNSSPTESLLASSAAASPAPSSSTPETSSPSQSDMNSTISGVVSSTSVTSSSYSSPTNGVTSASSSRSATSTSPAAVPGPLMTQSGSSTGSSDNIAIIAAPVAVGAVLVPILVLFFCWWKRRRSFRSAYHRRNRSNDTEMSNLSGDAQPSSHEPKTGPEERGMDARPVPGIRSTTPEQAEIKTWPIESTFAPGMLPGLAPRSPTSTSLASPPPYLQNERRSDSPTIHLLDPIEPHDATSSQKIAKPARRPISTQRHASIRAADIEWPMPSPFRDLSPKKEVRNVPPLLAVEGGRPGSSKTESSEPLPSPMMRLDRGEGVAGPSSPRPVLASSPRRPSPNTSERNFSRRSPFDDENANDSASEYSVSVRDKRPRSSMLNVPEEKQINDDGISEISITSRISNRKSRLNHRASDEISVVSSLDSNGDVGGLHEARAGKRRSEITALPDIDDA